VSDAAKKAALHRGAAGAGYRNRSWKYRANTGHPVDMSTGPARAAPDRAIGFTTSKNDRASDAGVDIVNPYR